MNFMFQDCPYYVLRDINLSSFNFKSIEDNKLLMFSGSQKIIIGKDSNFIPNSNISLLGNYFEYK